MNDKLEYDPNIEWSIGVHRNVAGEPLFVHGSTVVGTVDEIRGILDRYDAQQRTIPDRASSYDEAGDDCENWAYA